MRIRLPPAGRVKRTSRSTGNVPDAVRRALAARGRRRHRRGLRRSAPPRPADAVLRVTVTKRSERPVTAMLTIILIVLVLLLLFGGFGYSRRGRGI